MKHRIAPFENGFVVEREEGDTWETDSDKVLRYETAETIYDLRKRGIPRRAPAEGSMGPFNITIGYTYTKNLSGKPVDLSFGVV